MSGEPAPGAADWVTDLDDPAGEADVVPSRFRRLGRRQRALLAGAVALVVLLGAAAWFADRQHRPREFADLARCVASAEGSWAAADARIAAMASYVRPSVGTSPSAEVDRALYRLIADQAAVAVPPVRAALASCRDVAVLPVDGDLRAARSAYLAALGGEVDHLDATVADGSNAFAGTERLVELRARARSALTLAAPDARGRRQAAQLMVRR